MQSRALFLVAWDWEKEVNKYTPAQTSDQEETQFENFPLPHWLHYVRSLGKKSPVILAQTKVDQDGAKPIANRTILEQLYPIYYYCRVSAKTGRGMTDLKETILAAFQEMPEVGMEMPSSWYQVKEAIQDLAIQQTHIPYKQFEEICATQEVRPISRPSLLRYLHDTGVFFYKENLFHNQIILDQEWAIKAVYTLFDREQIYYDFLKRGNGQFTLKDLAKIWKDYTPEERNVFISFMESCEICFQINKNKKDETPIYIAPQLLPDEPTALVKMLWRGEATNSLHLIYQHPFLHQAIIQRFIVRAGHLSQEKELWKKGITFSYGDTQALIEVRPAPEQLIELPPQTNQTDIIYIQLKGKQQQALLQRIRQEFKDIQGMDLPPTQWISNNGQEFIRFQKYQEEYRVGLEEMLAHNGNKIQREDLRAFLSLSKEEGREGEEKGGLKELLPVVVVPPIVDPLAAINEIEQQGLIDSATLLQEKINDLKLSLITETDRSVRFKMETELENLEEKMTTIKATLKKK